MDQRMQPIADAAPLVAMKGPAAQRLKPEELWAKNDAQDGGRAAWYGKAVAYWDRQEASYDGVLGGYGSVSAVDVRDSAALLNKVRRAPHDRS